NTDPRMLIRLRELFGGTIRPVKREASHHKSRWMWSVTSAKVAPIIESVLPYLICKQDQAMLAMEFAATIGRKGAKHSPETVARREQIVQEIGVLKHIDFEEAM